MLVAECIIPGKTALPYERPECIGQGAVLIRIEQAKIVEIPRRKSARLRANSEVPFAAPTR